MSQKLTMIGSDENERRQEVRKLLVGTIMCFEHSSNDDILGLTSNVSASGACIYTAQSLQEGSGLSCTSRVLGKEPVHATVAWCRREGTELFRVGLSFLS